MWMGRAFQREGAATGKALSPQVRYYSSQMYEHLTSTYTMWVIFHITNQTGSFVAGDGWHGHGTSLSGSWSCVWVEPGEMV